MRIGKKNSVAGILQWQKACDPVTCLLRMPDALHGSIEWTAEIVKCYES